MSIAQASTSEAYTSLVSWSFKLHLRYSTFIEFYIPKRATQIKQVNK